MVFLFVLLSSLIIILAMMTARIEIKINNLIINSQDKKHIHDGYTIIIKLKIFKKISILKLTFTKNKLKRLQEMFKMNEKIKKIEEDIFENKNKIDIQLIKVIKELKNSIKVEKLNLDILLGTENAFLTAMLVAVFSSILSIGISRITLKEEEVHYEIGAIYANQNFVKIEISGIFQIKLIHIINIIYVFNKKGGRKYERTSNRRSYDYSYE